jgi:hypothetical protein
MIVQSLEISSQQLLDQTGWELKPQGACKGEVCIPLPEDIYTPQGRVKVEMLARRLNMPLVRAGEANLWALGPQAGGKALASADAPSFSLPDLANNRDFQLSELRGQKVLLVAWASW